MSRTNKDTGDSCPWAFAPLDDEQVQGEYAHLDIISGIEWAEIPNSYLIKLSDMMEVHEHFLEMFKRLGRFNITLSDPYKFIDGYYGFTDTLDEENLDEHQVDSDDIPEIEGYTFCEDLPEAYDEPLWSFQHITAHGDMSEDSISYSIVWVTKHTNDTMLVRWDIQKEVCDE